MQYVFLLYGDEAGYAQVSPEQRAADTAGHHAFFHEIQARNIQRGGAALQPTATATTVRVRGGKTLTTDGPFAETKEQLGGCYILECRDLDEATNWPPRSPAPILVRSRSGRSSRFHRHNHLHHRERHGLGRVPVSFAA